MELWAWLTLIGWATAVSGESLGGGPGGGYYIKAFGASPRPLINDSSKKRTLNSLFVMAHYPPLCPPACPPGRGSTIFIGELLQRTRSLPFNSVCFPERNTSKTAFHRIIIGSSWILTKAQNPFMLEKPRRNFLERSQISLLLLFLSLHSSFSSFSFRCRRLLCLIPGMDRQAVVSGSLSRCKMLIHPFSPLFLLPVLIDYEFAIGASRFSVAHKVNLLLHRGKPCYLEWQTRGQPRKKWKINGPGLKQNSKWLCSLYHLKNSFCCAIIAL